MRRALPAVVALLAVAAYGFAQSVDEENGKHTQLFPDKDHALGAAKLGGGPNQNLIDHGGAVMPNAHVVSIFWGPTWASGGSDHAKALELVSFFNQFGTTPEYNVITQYRVGLSALGNTAWYDTSTPPQNVSDSAIQNEVIRYLASSGAIVNESTIYEVFLPASSYASFGNSDSCGGPNLVFCAYHSNFSHVGLDIKYASMPYPSCSGCQWTGFTTAQNFEHFACHETREAVTDADGTAWFDRRGNEADDKCAWSPGPFIGWGGFAYQYEWSNSARGCVKTQ